MALDALDLSVGLVFCGLGASLLGNRMGRTPVVLMVATGALWLIGGVVEPLALAHRGPLVQLLVCHPRGRPRGRAEQVAVLCGYIDAMTPLGRVAPVTVALAGYVVAVVIRAYRQARGPQRRAKLTSAAASLAILGVLATGALAHAAGLHIEARVLASYELVLIAVALLLAFDLRWGRWESAAVTRLVIDLGEGASSSLRTRLADALGDSSLVIGYVVPGRTGVVDDAGRPVDVTPAPGRLVTAVCDGDRQLAVLIHDPSAVPDARLHASVTALARIALTNMRLHAEVQDRVADVAASRRRLLDVADAERVRLGDELRAGPQQRLEQIRDLLGPDAPGELANQVRAARASVRDFARGIYPRLLSERGLPAALAELAAAAPLPVELDVAPGRWPGSVEVTVYFLCAEALTNIAKYAQAHRASIRTITTTERLVVEICDDGVGGADPSNGSGLRGLMDRLDAHGGSLTLVSPGGGGTRLIATIPVSVGRTRSQEEGNVG